MGVGGQHHASAAIPSGKDLVPVAQVAGWSQGHSGLVRKISPPPGFDPWTVQHIVSSYTDYTIPARVITNNNNNNNK